MTEDERTILERYRDTFPVPVGQLAEDLRLTVVSTSDLPSGISGSISKEGDQYVIYVNAKQSPRRQRFTIAHEIGHYLQDKPYLDEADEILNPSKKAILARTDTGPASLVGNEVRKREYSADQFAGNLLMPETTFKEVWTSAQCLKDVADYFGVSEMAANVRAALLGLGYFDEVNGTT
jgi:Zn-dependent peptidase ImmA (M78 family)